MKHLDSSASENHPLKAIDLLEALAQTPENMGVSQLSESTGLSKSTVHRILGALVDRQYVIKDEATKQYRLGFKVLSLSANVLDSIEIKRLTRDEMLKLAKLTEETVHLICLDGGEGVYIDKIDTPNSIGLMSRIGKRLPLYCTSGGKALLSYQSPEWIDAYLRNTPFQKHTANTITDPEALRQELAQVRKQGFALDQEEHHENITCIAVPILKRGDQALASISLAAPSYRFSIQRALMYKDTMLEMAREISAKIS